MSDALYQLMLACWMSDPDERPDFMAVNATLRELAVDVEQVKIQHWAGTMKAALIKSRAGN
jgi:hypothetical protein